MSIKRVLDAEAAAVWAYRDSCVLDYMNDAPMGLGRTATAGVARVLELGALVDVPGAGARLSAGTSLADDALRIHEAVSVLPARQRVLVIVYARSGTRPAALAPVPRVRPRRNREGRVMDRDFAQAMRFPGRDAVTGQAFAMDFGAEAMFCPVILDASAERVAAQRRAWSTWRGGLCALADAFKGGGLDGIEVVAPLAPAFPWTDWARPMAARRCRE